jgi:hypothetical protein
MNTNTPTKTETLLGGTEFEATKLDGTKAKVFVRQIPVREMPAYLKCQDKEPEMIELVCKAKSDFVDNLTHESHAELVSEIERINSDFFTAWGRRQKARGERLKAGIASEPESGSPSQSASPTSLPTAPSSAE